MRETSDFSLGSLDPCPIRHYIHFHETYLHALMQVDHHSHFYLFVFFYFYFIPPFHYTSSDSFLFSSCLMFDLGSTSTLYSCLFDVSIPLSSLFVWGSLGLWLMRFLYALHLMHEGYEDYIIKIFESSFLLFLSPYYLSLRYVSCLKTTLRPWLHTLYLAAHTWAILEIGWRLFLWAWWMGSRGDDLH